MESARRSSCKRASPNPVILKSTPASQAKGSEAMMSSCLAAVLRTAAKQALATRGNAELAFLIPVFGSALHRADLKHDHKEPQCRHVNRQARELVAGARAEGAGAACAA